MPKVIQALLCVMSLSMMYFIINMVLTTVQKGNQFTNSAHFGV